jgi:hypothetical protein
LKVTVLEPRVAPNPVPEIVTKAFTPAIVGEIEVMFGATVNVTPLVAWLPSVTTTGPVEAVVGTGTTILVALQLVGVASTPLKVTVLEPCDEPKFVPAIVTEVPAAPEVGDRLVMVGILPKVPVGSQNAPLMTAFGPAVTVTLIFTCPEIFQTTYLPFVKLEMLLVSSTASVEALRT